MDRRAAKELLHIEGWLSRVDEIVHRGKDQLSWLTLSRDLPAWGDSLAELFGAAKSELETDAG